MKNLRSTVRPIALTLFAPGAGSLFILALEMVLHIELSKLLGSLVGFVFVAFFAFLIFPKILGIPFGRIETREFYGESGSIFQSAPGNTSS